MLDPNPSPTEVDDLSDEKGVRTGISASDVYDYYLFLWKQRDQWWWAAYGNDPEGFTIYDFLSIMAYHEAGFDTSMAFNLAEAGVRWFYEVIETNFLEPTINTLLDWWAKFSQSTAGLINNGLNLNPQLWTSIKGVEKMKIFGNSFQNPPNDWQMGWDYYRPYGWGNASVLTTDTAKMYSENLHAMFKTIVEGDPFYIPSGCAWYNWDEHDYYKEKCPSVSD